MELTDVLLALLVAMVTASWASLQARLGRHEGRFVGIEARLISIERELATKPSREEFEAFRAEMRAELATKPSREEFEAFRAEMRAELATKPSRDEFGSLRSEVTGIRADLTQIALAVGAGRPQASEG